MTKITCHLVTTFDNNISSEFTDDDEKLFEANEFLYLNQGPDPDMGLNFQSMQA